MRTKTDEHAKHNVRRSAFEHLESRVVLTTTMYLDFGIGLFDPQTGIATALETDVDEMRDVLGAGYTNLGTGPTLQGMLGEGEAIEFKPHDYDFDNDADVDIGDIQALSDAVLESIQRIIEPYDIDVVVVGATSIQDMISTVAQTGEGDAYLLIATGTFGGGSIGEVIVASEASGSFGLAAMDDLLGTKNNLQDELAVVATDQAEIFVDADFPGLQRGTQDYNDVLANYVAYTAVHEALHTFSFRHSGGGFGAGDWVDLLDGDVLVSNSNANGRALATSIPRFPVFVGDTGTGDADGYVNRAERAESIIGLRDADASGKPDLVYVTGTGSHDVIRLTPDPSNSSVVTVRVTPYSDSSRMQGIAPHPFGPPNPEAFSSSLIFHEYSIDLEDQTDDGVLLIDSSHGSDLIEIDAGISASFRIRTLAGDDIVKIVGASTPRMRGLIIEGEAGDDTVEFDFRNNRDPLPLAGFDFAFDGGEGIDATEVRLVGSNDPVPAWFVDNEVSTSYTPQGNAVLTITSPLGDLADFDLTDGDADVIPGNSDDDITLRAAIQEANVAGGERYIFLPSTTLDLTLTSGPTSSGDLDISGNVKIIGAGAGASVIDASGLSQERHFEVLPGNGSLHLERLTLTGGTGPVGASIYVGDHANPSGTALQLEEVAVVDNSNCDLPEGIGAVGAVYVGPGANATISRSVVANSSDVWVTGGIYAHADSTGFAEVTLTESVVVNNDTSNGHDDLARGEDPGGNLGTFYSGGHNLIGVASGVDFPTNEGSTILNGSVDHVVTSVVDS
jgi:hypothetical protein